MCFWFLPIWWVYVPVFLFNFFFNWRIIALQNFAVFCQTSTWISLYDIGIHIFKLVLEKAEEPEIKLPNICWIIEKAREIQKNIYFCFIDYAKGLDCVDHNKLWKILRWEYQTTWPASWEICMQFKKQQLKLDMEQQTGSK